MKDGIEYLAEKRRWKISVVSENLLFVGFEKDKRTAHDLYRTLHQLGSEKVA